MIKLDSSQECKVDLILEILLMGEERDSILYSHFIFILIFGELILKNNYYNYIKYLHDSKVKSIKQGTFREVQILSLSLPLPSLPYFLGNH